jgi:hypothetical protein
VGTDGAFADHDPMAGTEDVGDVGRRTRQPFGPQRSRLGQQFGVAAHLTGVGAADRTQAHKAVGLVGGDPAVQRAAAIGTHGPVGMGVGLGGERADDPATLGRGQPGVGGLGNHAVAEQGDLLGGIVRPGRVGGGHGHLLCGWGSGHGRQPTGPASSCPGRARGGAQPPAAADDPRQRPDGRRGPTQPPRHPSSQRLKRGQDCTLSHAGQAIDQPAELDHQRAQPGHQHRRAP